MCGYEPVIFFGSIIVFTFLAATTLFKHRGQYRKQSLIPYSIAFFVIILSYIFLSVAGAAVAYVSLIKHAEADVKQTIEQVTAVEKSSDYITDIELIGEHISQQKRPFLFENDDAKLNLVLETRGTHLKTTDTYYHNIIIPWVNKNSTTKTSWEEVPYYAVLTTKTDTTHIFRTNQEVVQYITEAAGTRVLSSIFPDLVNQDKEYTYKVLETDEYTAYQHQRVDEVKQEYQDYIALIENEIARSQNYIAQNNAAIAMIPAGSPYRGQAQQMVNQYNAQASAYIADLQYYHSIASENYEQFLKNPVTPELQAGIFMHPNEIIIRYFTPEERQPHFSEYLYTTVHEQMHMYSYDVGETSLPTYFEEGMTDYISYRVMKETMGYDYTNNASSYMHEVQVVKMLGTRIPKDTLLEIYFNKDEELLQSAIAEHFPDVTYEEYATLADSLFYADPYDRKTKKAYVSRIYSLLFETPEQEG